MPPALPTSFPGDCRSFGIPLCTCVRSRVCVRVYAPISQISTLRSSCVRVRRRSSTRASAFARRTSREAKTFQSAFTRCRRNTSSMRVLFRAAYSRRCAYPISGASRFSRNANPDFVKTECSHANVCRRPGVFHSEDSCTSLEGGGGGMHSVLD